MYIGSKMIFLWDIFFHSGKNEGCCLLVYEALFAFRRESAKIQSLVTLKMEAIYSSETSVLVISATWHYIPEGNIV
jgi:hypothetical protein